MLLFPEPIRRVEAPIRADAPVTISIVYDPSRQRMTIEKTNINRQGAQDLLRLALRATEGIPV